MGIPQTPRGASQGQSLDSGRGYRLSTASRLPAGTPLTRGFSNLHAGYTAQRNPSSARSRGLGVGLSAGIRASQTGNGPAEPRETTPHHKGMRIASAASHTLLMARHSCQPSSSGTFCFRTPDKHVNNTTIRHDVWYLIMTEQTNYERAGEGKR